MDDTRADAEEGDSALRVIQKMDPEIAETDGDDGSDGAVGEPVVGRLGDGSDGGSSDEELGRETAAEASRPARRQLQRRTRASSLELRKVPAHILLSDHMSVIDDLESTKDHLDANDDIERPSEVGWILRPCLRPKFSLRTQMMISFGTVSAVTILFVMVTAIIASVVSGDRIKSESKDTVEAWIKDSLRTSALLSAEALSPRIIPNDLVQIMYEATRDRFAGYPTTPDDSKVPFSDTTTQRNVYPLQGPPLPLDWQFTPEEGNVNDQNYKEHVQDRWSMYDLKPRLSTAGALYFMQGACDPRETDPQQTTYYPNCTDANNDLSTGGLVAPTPTNEQIARKAADLSPLLKALYEEHQDVKELGVFFSNEGAGSSLMYPHYELDGTTSYTSIGCDWMNEQHPIDRNRSIGTQEEIDRCHPEGETVPGREYNNLERGWCRDQVLNPGKIHNVGPYLDAWSKTPTWLMTAGRAVYDRVTGEFIACLYIGFTLDRINEIIDDAKLSNWSMFTLVRWDENGSVVVSPNFDHETATDTTTVDDESLDIGVDRSIFEEIKSLVDFSEPWDPREVREVYKTNFYEKDGKWVTGYPIPTLPDTYDADYRPEFMVILSVDKAQETVQTQNAMETAIDDQVKALVALTLVIGFVGLAVVIVLIFIASVHLTEPLEWMNSIADQIVGKFGEDLDEAIDYERKKEAFRFTPKTELNDLVREFQKMVSQFSGEGTAKSAKFRRKEVRNQFTLFEKFRGLYLSRKEPGFKYNYEPSPSYQVESDGQVETEPERLHFGPNVFDADAETIARSLAPNENTNTFASPLFWWIVALIVVPLLATTVSISAPVLYKISTQLTSLIVPVEDTFLDLREKTRFTAATIKAAQGSGATGRPARDLHVVTRFASWLFFGGIQMSGSTTEMIRGAEECKTASAPGTCEFFKDEPCDCDWNDISGMGTCSSFSNDSRYLQLVFFEGQSQDAWPNGDRNFTSFPNVDFRPNATAWWDNVDEVPGFDKGPLAAAGYGTTYDRVKVLSALSTVFIPLYNYDAGVDRQILALDIGFEADGSMGGYTGCNYGFVDYPFWQSSESNGAESIRPELCPLGKFGYDCRCRGWYDGSRRMAMKDVGPALYVTPPYTFATNNEKAQSASSPLIDPNTQTIIGQGLVDFLPTAFFRSLDNIPLANGGFPILITPEKDSVGFDTVLGPGFSYDESSGGLIEELVLPHDKRNCYEDHCTEWQEFNTILTKMKAGMNGTGVFNRTSSDGETEKFYVSYAPVVVKSYRPVNSSDFSSGVQEYDSLIYMLALVEPKKGLLESFRVVEDTVKKQVNICIGVLAALIFLAMAFVIYISERLTASIIKPVIRLLGMIKKINRLEISDDDLIELDQFSGASREISNVYDTLEMLYKVVRFANAAFFAGDLDEAYRVLKDALRLFTRLGNKKAIAVSSNNLGNMMLTMYRTMMTTKETHICGMTKKQIIAKGIAYFARAIKLGEEAYDQFYESEGWSERCLGFMQHLSNRYFNRAMFLLTVKDDHGKPDEAKSLGLRDLQIVQDMDIEVVDQCVEMGFAIDKVGRYDLVMSRIRGLLRLKKLGCDIDDFGVEEHIEEIVKELKAAMTNQSFELFDSIGPAGRMQQIDVELLKYVKLMKKDVAEAARIGIRMLVEDDYTFPDAQYKAISALVDYIDAQGTRESDPSNAETRETLRIYQMRLEKDLLDDTTTALGSWKSLRTLRRGSVQEDGKSLQEDGKVRRFSLTRKKGGSGRKPHVSEERLSICMKECTRGDITMEAF